MLGGTTDAFVTKLDAAGSALVYSTFLGGSSDDGGTGIALDASGNAYVTGATSSANFPTTPGAFDTTFNGVVDTFVAKIAEAAAETTGKVTGGGSVDVAGGIATFGFVVERQTLTGPISGKLQYVNHASGANVRSVALTSLVVTGNSATFGGTCTNNGAACTFTVDVTDNGEPGTADTFTISVSGGPTEGGTLRSGNIQVHQ